MAHTARRRTVTMGMVAALALALPAAATYPTQTVLSGAPTATTHVGRAEISPDGAWVVFTANLRNKGTELWSLPLDGSTTTPIRLTNTPVPGGGVWPTDVVISPDSRYVVTTGDLEVDEQWHVYSVPIDRGGQQLRLSGGNGRVNTTPRISPDSSRVLYIEDLNAPNVHELFSAPIRAADSQITLSTTVVSEGDVTGMTFAPDGTHVAYLGDLTVDDHWEVYVAPVDTAGGQATLSQAPPTGNVTSGPRISPDGTTVVYAGDLTVDERFEVYSRPLDASRDQVRLSSSAHPAGDAGLVTITPDSSTVVYRGDLTTDEIQGVYAAPIGTSGGQVPLSNSSVPGATVQSLAISPDGARVVYRGDLREAAVNELFSAPVDGSTTQVRLTATPPTGGDVAAFEIAPDAATVLVSGDLRVDGRREVFLAPIDAGGGQVVLSGPASAGAATQARAQFAPDGTRVAFVGDYDGDGVDNLYSVAVADPGNRTRVSTPPIDGGDVDWESIRFAPDSSFLVYIGDLLTDERRELFGSGAGQQPAHAPTGVTATSVTETSARITWQRPWGGSQVTGYEVTPTPAAPSGSSGAPRRAAVAVGPDQTTTTLTGLAPGTAYTVSVTAGNDAGASAPGTVSFTTAGDPVPEPPPGPDGIQRLSGDNRYATAAAIAMDRFDVDAVDTVYLATGANFPDALAGGPLAAVDGAPILLTTRDRLPEVTAAAIAAFAPNRLVLLGGPAAISEDVRIEAAVAAGMSDQLVERIAGDNRYATAAAIAARLPAGDTVFLATGTNFPDALTGGAATGGAPILLTLPDSLPGDTAGALADLAPATVTALGGVAAVADATLATAGTAAGGASTERLSGDNRFATATAIADTLPTPDTIYVAVGANFPDALAGGPPASAESAPILLVTTASIPEVIATWIDDLPALRRIVILGGEGAIAVAVEDQLRALLD